jgi:hypothetical protein
MKFFQIAAYSVVTLYLLQGCTLVNERNCLTANWEGAGYADGVIGKSSEQKDVYREICAAHNVQPDMKAYMHGYNKGIKSYCTPDIAYTIGTTVNNVPDVCPSELARNLNSFKVVGIDNQIEVKTEDWSSNNKWVLGCLPYGSGC